MRIRSSVSNHEFGFSDHDGRGPRPAARDIGQRQIVNVATAIDIPAVSDQIDLHAAGKRLVPVGKSAHFDTPLRLWH